MKKKPIINKKLKQYTAFSGALIGLTSVDGQVIYTDRNDVNVLPTAAIVNAGSESYYLDMDGDGNEDFVFREVYTITSGGSSGGISIFLEENGNNTGMYIDSYQGTPDNGQDIAASFQNSGVPVNGFGFGGGRFPIWNRAFSSSSFQPPNSVNCNEDRYIPVAFRKSATDLHYGWIRLAVDCTDPNDPTIILKSTAYQSIPAGMLGAEIETGEGDPTLSTIEENLNNQKLSYAINGKQLFLRREVEVQEVDVYNVNGQRVLNSEVINNQVSLSDLELGAYIVNAKTDKGTESFKIILK